MGIKLVPDSESESRLISMGETKVYYRDLSCRKLISTVFRALAPEPVPLLEPNLITSVNSYAEPQLITWSNITVLIFVRLFF